MKKRKILTLTAVVLAVVLCFAGCSEIYQRAENAEIHQQTRAMLDAVIANDLDAAYAMVSDVFAMEDFQPNFEVLAELVSGTEGYELEMLSYYTYSSLVNGNRTQTVQSVYEMTTETERFIVEVVIDSYLGMTTFRMARYEETDYYYTGLLGHMEDADIVQWGLLLSNVVAIGLTVIALVDCCRHSMKRKKTWIAVLILGFMTLGVSTAAGGVRLHFNFGWLLNYTALIRYGGGTNMLRALVPVGAVAYFIARRKILKKDAPKVTEAIE